MCGAPCPRVPAAAATSARDTSPPPYQVSKRPSLNRAFEKLQIGATCRHESCLEHVVDSGAGEAEARTYFCGSTWTRPKITSSPSAW
jgi:hypothetical protein